MEGQYQQGQPHSESAKKFVSKILGVPALLKKGKKTADDHRKIVFCRMIDDVVFVVERQLAMHDAYELDLQKFETVWFDILNDLLKLSFNEAQRNLIDFYVYHRYDERGEVIPLYDDAGKPYVLQTPEDLYEVVKMFK